MSEKDQFKAKKILDEQGNEHVIALDWEIRGRKFIITTDKKIFEKDENGSIKVCTQSDEETKFLSKYLEEPKSLDIEL